MFKRLLVLLDKEFVEGRGRTVSLQHRFPHILRPDRLDSLLTASFGDILCGGAVVRTFDWRAEGRFWKGAMVGMVCVAPSFRERGVGSALLRGLMDKLCMTDLDFAALWTSKHPFYERLGWKAHLDGGMFGRLDFTGELGAKPSMVPLGLGDVDLDRIEDRRSSLCSSGVLRTAADYRALPAPADTVEFFVYIDGPGTRGYAIVGRKDQAGYLYELVSRKEDFPAFLSSFSRAYATMFINEHKSGPFYMWLWHNGLGIWERQDQTLWFNFSKDSGTVDLPTWHIPYFDRI